MSQTKQKSLRILNNGKGEELWPSVQTTFLNKSDEDNKDDQWEPKK